MKNDVELMNLFWSTAGVLPGVAEISPYTFQERVESAARAGFKGIGIWHTDLEQILQHTTLKDMKTILDGNGMKHLELEFLEDWFLTGEKKAASDRRKRWLLEAAEVLGAKHIKVGDFNNTPCPMPQIIESFAALCADAAEHGATIGFELMASAMIDNFEDALTLVESAGFSNGGLIVDIVHVMTLGISYDDLRRLPVHYLVNLELNDGYLPGSPNYDSSGDRLFCGEGEYDIQGFIACARDMGYRGPWAVEVFAKALAGWSLDELNTRAFETTMAQFGD